MKRRRSTRKEFKKRTLTFFSSVPCAPAISETRIQSTSAFALFARSAFSSTLSTIQRKIAAQTVKLQSLLEENLWKTWYATRPFKKLLIWCTLNSKSRTEKRSKPCTKLLWMPDSHYQKTQLWSTTGTTTKKSTKADAANEVNLE